MNIFVVPPERHRAPSPVVVELKDLNTAPLQPRPTHDPLQQTHDPPQQVPDPAVWYNGAIDGDASHEYLTDLRLAVVSAAATMAVFLTMLDSSIVSTAIPRITDEFHSLDDIGWYVSVYQLSNAAFQPLTGKIYTKFNIKWSFLLFFAVFEAGSTMCAAACSSPAFIIGRSIAGLGSAGLLNGALTIVASAVAVDRRPSLMGAMMGISQLGIVIGPVLGGAFTSLSTWRWCFYVNLPVGGLVLLCLVFIQVPEQIQKGSPLEVFKNLHNELDLAGFVLFAPSPVMLLLALQLGGSAFAWDSSTIIGLFCRAGASGILWLAWDWYCGDEGMVPFSMMRRGVVISGSFTQWFAMTSLFAASYFIPLYFQGVKGASPIMSGVYVLVSIVIQLLCAVLSGFLVEKTGYIVPYAVFSGVVSAVSNGLYSTLSPTSSVGKWVSYQILNGIGRGTGMQMALLAVQMVLGPADLAIGMALLVFFGMLGTSITLAVCNVIFSQTLRAELMQRVPEAELYRIIQAGATGFRKVVGEEQLASVVEAYSIGINRVFYLVAGLAALSVFSSLFLGWTNVREREAQGDADDMPAF